MTVATPPPVKEEKPVDKSKQPEAPAAAAPASKPPVVASTTPRTHNTAIVAVVMAIVIALGLGAIGAMAYLNTSKNVQPVQQGTTVAPTPKVTSEDIDKSKDEINSSLKSINDQEDFGANDMSDATLGLQ